MRLGHGSALTSHSDVIHSLTAASLPHRRGLRLDLHRTKPPSEEGGGSAIDKYTIQLYFVAETEGEIYVKFMIAIWFKYIIHSSLPQSPTAPAPSSDGAKIVTFFYKTGGY